MSTALRRCPPMPRPERQHYYTGRRKLTGGAGRWVQSGGDRPVRGDGDSCSARLSRCLGNAGRWAQPSGARKPSRGDADSSSDRATIEGTLDDPSHRRPKELFRERDCLGTNNAER
ncbi:hypothetical protein AAFF_G00029420 [Aldrovandia affinis]|uniref:Uncharacterized protein n=1 Tax=Aldrovandia affinis TaxID=143900 RepID=A0AAD7S4B0_9TELE|nr:hypothetical protein AAFF_G00029420 [Aldrovandia affinis]